MQDLFVLSMGPGNGAERVAWALESRSNGLG